MKVLPHDAGGSHRLGEINKPIKLDNMKELHRSAV